MRNRRTLAVAVYKRWSPGLLLAALCGCALVPPNSFLDQTKVGRFPIDTYEGGIRRVLSPRETPPGIADATDPTPDDLVAVYSDYRLGPGDAVNITIQDLLTSGQPYAAVVEVSPLGEIRIPDLGSIKVAGLTEQEVEQEITARLKEGGLLPRPVVVVVTQLKRGRLFHIVGAIRSSGVYPISEPDLRLLEAIGMAGDSDATARRAYVIRRAASPEPQTAPPTGPVDEGLVIPPPDEEGLRPAQFMTQISSPPEQPAVETQPTKDELVEVLAPTEAPAQPATGQRREPQFEPLVIFDPQTGAVLPAEPEKAPAPEPPPGPAAAPVAVEDEPLDEPFDWDKTASLGLEQRVISIDLTALKAGNPRYNIVVRDRDVINIPVDTGVFYLMGEVNRPGVYGFGGREITIKQALAICGGFSPMAWPQRCELIRREPGTDKQVIRTVNLDAIFAGLEDDFFLRDEDVLNVGTHIVAPFLFVIRNSFRFTYGFGFVYDRNFADKDAYSNRINPEIVEQQRRASRGLSF